MKWLASACALCLLAVLATLYLQLRPGDVDVPVAAAGATAATSPAAAPGAAARRDDAAELAASTADDRALALADELRAARRSCDADRLDACIERLRAEVARRPQQAYCRRLCAEALLERVLLRSQHRGMQVGAPLYDELPAEVEADVAAALDLLEQARARGDESADNHRIEAVLLSQRITGLASALQYNGQIQRALERAAAADAQAPALHVTLGLRKLLAPRLLGHDPERALEHLAFAAAAMPDDERPRVFAAMACHLLRKRQEAVTWLEQAVACNPDNAFARAVLERVRRGEPEPFARDLGTTELR